MANYITAFLTPNNELFPMNYNKIEEFCKKECQHPKNIENFLEFKKDYTYYHPYFDFVMFELNYQLINPLLRKGTALGKKGDALYQVKCNNINYNEIQEEIEKTFSQKIPLLAKCSNTELGIKKQSKENIDHCMIDPNLIGQMSKESHVLTSNIILNQLLINSENIMKDYYEFYQTEPYDDDNMPINYLINNFGFIRAIPIDVYPILILTEEALTKTQQELAEHCKNNNYEVLTTGVCYNNLQAEYKQLVKNDKN